ncbi:MAG: hypothetical protein IPL84_14710 [Chitinophagaceae bacterium]|nr:hypothetical protein [Chitinophagaceae bacterium]
MRIVILTSIICLFGFGTSAQNFGGNPSTLKWFQVNTGRVRVIFPQGLDSQANRIANVMKLLGDTTAATIGGGQKKWNLVLQNQSTISNAYVRLAPRMSELFMTPPQNSFGTGSIRWDDNLIIHENRHIQQLSNFNKGFTKVFSFLLGEEGQLLANGMTVPDYFFEGDAVWQETLVSAQGRGRMPSFYNGFKSLWLEQKHYSWMKLRSGSYKHFTPDHYALGYLLTAYGYEKYGDQFWNKVTGDAVRFRSVFYPFNQAIQRYSGKPYKQFRQDALDYFREKSFLGVTAPATTYTDITKEEKNNVVDYQFPNYISDDSILVTKKSLKEISAFYVLSNGKETKLKVRDVVIDDYYSYKNGKIVFAAYQSDPRWTNRDYSVLKVLDMYTGVQKQISSRSNYFSPDINADGTEILAISVNPDGTNFLCRLDANTGDLIKQYPNSTNYFYTQTRFAGKSIAISAVRNPEGNMVLLKTNLETGIAENITSFSFNVLGYPFVKNDTVYFNAMHGNADKIFAITLKDNKLYQLTNNINGIYHPAVNNKGDMLVSRFTTGGYRLSQIHLLKDDWKEISSNQFIMVQHAFYAESLEFRAGAGSLYSLNDHPFKNSSTGSNKNPVTPYRKSFRLFNFHSWRPVVDDPEYGYSFYSDNVLSSFRNNVTYTYNRTDRSHTLGFGSTYSGWFPVLSLGVEESFNRTVDTAFNRSVSYNSAKVVAGFSVPLRFVNGRTTKLLTAGANFNLEQYYYRGVSKNVFSNRAIQYMNSFLSFSNIGRQAKQHINPRWAQSVSLSYRDAFNFSNSHKFNANASFYFPGLGRSHSLVLNAAYQSRDTMPDLFSKVFSYSRGYEALTTRRMYKIGVNYHFPIIYPDWGFANMLFFQRIRANAFYDHTSAKARVNNLLTEIKNRSTGAEIYFDTKIWNAYPVSFGLRFSHLLDTDLLNPLVKNKWEIIIPIGLIPD